MPHLPSIRLPSAGILASLVALLSPSLANAICYVKPSGTSANSGASWSAPKDLKSALLAASCDEIWVSAGVYKPSAGPFTLNPGVEVYGGFAGIPGSEGNFSVRDPATQFTVLSGDIDNNDVVDVHGITVRYQDVVGNNASILRIAPSTPMLSDSVLDGMHITGASFMQAAIDGASNSPGNEFSPTFRNLTFSGNRGRAMNVITSAGGSSRIKVSDSTFRNNAILEQGMGTGGAIYMYSATGGDIIATYTNVTFSGNFADGQGGAVYIFGDTAASALFVHATFSNNSAGQQGGAVLVQPGQGGVSARFVNSIFWGNTAPVGPEIGLPDFFGTAIASLYQSIVQSGCPMLAYCSNLVNGNPQLGPLQSNGGPTLTMLPAAGGAAIDAASLIYCPPTDQRGIARPQGAGCDMGAVESTDPLLRNGFDS